MTRTRSSKARRIGVLALTLGALACGESGSASKSAAEASEQASLGSDSGAPSGRPPLEVRMGKPRPPRMTDSPGIMCSAEACVSPDARVYPCCLPDDTCGAGENGECRAFDQPGTRDSACASHSAWDGTLEFAGCCRPDGACGVDVTLGFGCVERSDLPVYLGGPLEATKCDAGKK